jgi:hypothetical protein
MFKKLCLLVLIAAAVVLPASPARAQARSLQAAAADTIVATVDGQRIQPSDVDAYSRTADARQLFLLNRQLQDPRRDVVESLNDERLLNAEAARLGTTTSRLLSERLKPARVTDAEILHTFEQIKAQQSSVSYDEMLPLIRTQLQGMHRSQALAAYVRDLKRAAR